MAQLSRPKRQSRTNAEGSKRGLPRGRGDGSSTTRRRNILRNRGVHPTKGQTISNSPPQFEVNLTRTKGPQKDLSSADVSLPVQNVDGSGSRHNEITVVPPKQGTSRARSPLKRKIRSTTERSVRQRLSEDKREREKDLGSREDGVGEELSYEPDEEDDGEVYPVPITVPLPLRRTMQSLEETIDPDRRELLFGEKSLSRPRRPVNIEGTTVDMSDDIDLNDSMQLGDRSAPLTRTMSDFEALRTMLEKLYSDIERSLQSEVKSLRGFMHQQFEEFRLKLDTHSSQISEIRVISCTGKQNNILHGKTPLGKYEEILDSATPHARWVFDTDTICKVLQVNIPHMVISILKESGSMIDNVSLAVRALLFGLKPTQTRSAFGVGAGKKHSAFRFSVVLNALFNVQSNRFGRLHITEMTPDLTHSPSSLSGDEGMNSRSNIGKRRCINPGQERLEHPDWLMPGFIKQRDVSDARKRLESHAKRMNVDETGEKSTKTNKPRHWLTVKETPSQRDISVFGALKVYRIVINALNNAREKARLRLFEVLVYTMCDWEDLRAPVSQRDLQMQWALEFRECEDVIVFDIPRCVLRSSDSSSADESNKKLFGTLLDERKDMVVFVSHEVTVRPSSKSKKSRRDFEKKTLTRAINLIDVAAKFCVVFTQQTQVGYSPVQFLGANLDSLRCIFGISMLLRSLVQAFMDQYVVEGRFIDSNTKNISRVSSHGIQLSSLYPAESVQSRLLSSRCFRLTEDEFTQLHPRSGFSCPEPAETEYEEAGDDIFPSSENGVMLL